MKGKVLHVITWIGDRGSEKTCLNSAKSMPDFEHIFLAKFVNSREALSNFSAVGTVIIEDSMDGGMFNYPIVTNEFIAEHGIDLMVVYLPGDGLPPYITKVDCPKILHVLCTKLCNFNRDYFAEVTVPSKHAISVNPHLQPIYCYPMVERLEANSTKLDIIKTYFPKIDPTDNILISRIGSIETVKHVEDFLAVAKYFSHVDNMLFLFAGVGDNKYINALMNHYGSDKVVYAGVITEQEKANINSATDICLYPTEFEAFGYSMAEPMSHSTPVITYNETASPETVGDGGLVVEFNNLNKLAEAVASLVTRPYLAHVLGKQAYTRWADNFSPEAYGSKTREIYERILNGHEN